MEKNLEKKKIYCHLVSYLLKIYVRSESGTKPRSAISGTDPYRNLTYPLTNGSGSRRPQNIRILRIQIWIPNTAINLNFILLFGQWSKSVSRYGSHKMRRRVRTHVVAKSDFSKECEVGSTFKFSIWHFWDALQSLAIALQKLNIKFSY
jgi:hypothetical protein